MNRLVLLGLFLGLLELVREKLITAEQEQSLGTIYMRPLTDVPAAQAVKEAMLATAVEETPQQPVNESAAETEMLPFNEEMETPEEIGGLATIDELDIVDSSSLPEEIEEPDKQ